ncbi:MAG TPA: sulfurtransferase TusA family protein [Actinomycetota bacterium]|jgi:tRNA 2-thiouridine synthesizing protein A|nr:sulfurtransferase TusA family protein [Actinomycetota bacterium]
MAVTAKATLDAKGLSCPLPVVKARLEMEKLDSGDVLAVLATDPGSVADFDNWTKMSGHELLSSDESDGVYSYLIRKGA